jgi:hypothetical protein
MTPDEVIAMAREAGIVTGDGLRFADGQRYRSIGVPRNVNESSLLTFAALVAAKEREACADLCDRFAARTTEAQQGPSDSLSNVMLRQIAVLGHCECAAAIRARDKAMKGETNVT